MISHGAAQLLGSIQPRHTDDHFSSQRQKILSLLIALFDSLLEKTERRRERVALSRMDRRELQDIGLTHGDIARVMDKSDGRPRGR
jgi:uncharacterized protein YjiS (DUF1127 family)